MRGLDRGLSDQRNHNATQVGIASAGRGQTHWSTGSREHGVNPIRPLRDVPLAGAKLALSDLSTQASWGTSSLSRNPSARSPLITRESQVTALLPRLDRLNPCIKVRLSARRIAPAGGCYTTVARPGAASAIGRRASGMRPG